LVKRPCQKKAGRRAGSGELFGFCFLPFFFGG